MGCSTLQSPMYSSGLQWTSPSQSSGFPLSPQDSLSVHRIPSQSCGLVPLSPVDSPLSPLDSLLVQWTSPSQSSESPLSPVNSLSVQWIPLLVQWTSPSQSSGMCTISKLEKKLFLFFMYTKISNLPK